MGITRGLCIVTSIYIFIVLYVRFLLTCHSISIEFMCWKEELLPPRWATVVADARLWLQGDKSPRMDFRAWGERSFCIPSFTGERMR